MSGGDAGRPLDSALASRVPLGNGLSLRASEQGESQLLHLPGAPGIDWHLIIVCDEGTCADFTPSLVSSGCFYRRWSGPPSSGLLHRDITVLLS